MATDIKPCPFCGNTRAVPRTRHIGTPWTRYECISCGALGPEREDRGDAAANAWNNRPAEDAQAACIADIREQLAALSPAEYARLHLGEPSE